MTLADSESDMKPEVCPPCCTRLKSICVFGAMIVAVVAGGSWWLQHQAMSYQVAMPADPNRIGKPAPFITTPDIVADKMIEMAELTPDDVVYDLGCGDGRLVITAALKSGCRGVGFDNDPERIVEARANVKLHGVEELVEIREQDIFTVDLSQSSVVLMYLLPWMNRQLVPQLQQMHPGSRIISHDFALGQDVNYIKPNEIVVVSVGERQLEDARLLKWVAPLNVPPKKEPDH